VRVSTGSLVGVGRVQPFVQAVVADVEPAAEEPLGERLVPLEDFLPGLEPDEFGLGLSGPEFFGRLDGLVVEFLVLGEGLDVGAGGKGLGRLEDAVLLEDGFEVGEGIIGHNVQDFPQKY
jgi:hypothetical protein